MSTSIHIDDEQIINYNKYKLDVQCPSCLLVSNDLVEIKDCGHLLCNECYKNNNIKLCLICQIPVSQINVPHSIIKMVNNMNTKCETCTKIIKIGEINLHKNTCELAIITCSCDYECPRKDYEIHINTCVLSGKQILELPKKYIVCQLEHTEALQIKLNRNDDQIKILHDKQKHIECLKKELNEKQMIIEKYEDDQKAFDTMNDMIAQNKLLVCLNQQYMDHMMSMAMPVELHSIDKNHPKYCSFKLSIKGGDCDKNKIDQNIIFNINRSGGPFYNRSPPCEFLAISDINDRFKKIKFDEMLLKVYVGDDSFYILPNIKYQNVPFKTLNDIHIKLNSMSDAYKINDDMNIDMIVKDQYFGLLE
jgi:hypothetical protein